MLFYTRAREALLLMKRFYFFYFVSEGRRRRREISVVVVSLRDENAEAASSTEAEREREKEREHRRESGTKQRREREREAKKYELLKNERTPPFSLSLSVCFLKLSPARAREEGREQMRRNREEEEEGNAREERGECERRPRRLLSRSPKRFVFCISVANRGLFSPKEGEQAHPKKIDKAQKHTKKKKIFATVVRFKTKRRPKREKKGERRKFSSLRSQPLSLFLSLQNRSARIFQTRIFEPFTARQPGRIPVDSPVHVLLDRFQAEKIERKLRKSIAFVARVRAGGRG